MSLKSRIAAALAALILVLQAIPFPAQAAGSVEAPGLKQLIIDSYDLENEALGDNTSLAADAVHCYGQKVSIEEYGLSGEQFSAVFYEVLDSGALPWYAAPQYSYTHDEGIDIVKTFSPMYLHPDVYDRTLYEQTVAQILAATVYEGMDQWQAALSIHDYLVSHYSYDESLTRFRGYDLLVNGTAVCSGYAEAYQDLLERVGIESIIVSSQTMGDIGHAWNLVNIYGQWYHVDVTWDDPTPDAYGYVDHDYFLVTDDEIGSEEGGHFDWNTDIQCTDTSYANAFWKDIDNAINYPSSQYSYYREDDPDSRTSYIICREEGPGQTAIVHMSDAQYMDLGDGVTANYPHYGASLWNGRLYVSTMDSVYSIAPDGSDLRTEYTYDVSANGKCIYGAFVENGVLYLTLTDPEFNYTSMEIALDPASYQPFHTHSYTSTVADASCTENGFSVYTCACGITFEADPTPAKGHTYGEGVVLLEATTSQAGIIEYSCVNGDDSYTEQIQQLPSEGLEAVFGPDSGAFSLVFIISGLALLVIMICAIGRRKKAKK